MVRIYKLDARIKFFRTKYRFRNKADEDHFFDDLVINNVYSYPRIFREWFIEKLEIMRTYKILLFSISGITGLFTVISLFKGYIGQGLINGTISIVLLTLGLILRKRVEVQANKLGFTEELNAGEGFLKMMRDSRIDWLREDHPERLRAVNYKEDEGTSKPLSVP
jgi:hypothetical protein